MVTPGLHFIIGALPGKQLKSSKANLGGGFMKRFLSLLFTCLLFGALAWAAPQQASLTLVKAKHPRVQRHRAHKATKHHQPKRHRRSV
jgi:hypothetical protein